MIKIPFEKILFLLTIIFTFSCADCFIDSAWEAIPFQKKVTFLESHAGSLTGLCLCKFIAKTDYPADQNYDSFISVLQKWSKTNIFDNSILFAAYNNQSLHRNRALWSQIIKLWESSNKSPYAAVVLLINSGAPLRADTLLSILDSEGKVDIPELLRWTKVKLIIKDYSSIAALYCRILNRGDTFPNDSTYSKSSYLTLNQFSSQMQELGGEYADRILQQFRKCSLEKIDADTIQLRNWLSKTYSHLDMFDRELEILTSIQTEKTKQFLSTELIEIAKDRFLFKKLVPALHAAKAAYNKTNDKELQSNAASIIYQSFLSLGLADSAVKWLKKTDISSENRIIEAIELYQNAGQVQQSRNLITRLRSSLSKDTLLVRQYIFMDSIDKAIELVENSPYLRQSASDMMLWKIRLLLFDKEFSKVLEVYDSVPIPLESNISTELLLYKYWLERLQDCPEALATWATIEYNIYKGMHENCVSLVKNNNVESTCQWRLALRVACAMHEKRKTSAALTVLKEYDENTVSAEFLYFKGQFLFETGEIDSAKVLLQKIVLDYSSDIFSGKARLLLTRME